MVRRKNTLPKGSFLHRRSRIHTFFSHIAHKRRNTRFKGLRRVHTPPHPPNAHTAAYTAKQGAFRMGALSLPSERFARFGNPARPGLKTANFAAFGPWPGVLPKNAESLRDSDAFMRVAVPRRHGPAGLRIPWLFLSPHRWVSRFWSAASLAHRKLSACSLVTAVRFLNRCSRRSTRGTCPSERRSGCRF